jgi:heptosyltransferase-1
MRFLIIKTSALGDIIHAFTALAFLHKKFPSASIDWVVEAPYASLLNAHPHISKVFPVETKKWRRGRHLNTFWEFKKSIGKQSYDAVFDLQGNIKSGLLTSCAKAKEKIGFSWKTLPEWPNGLFTNRKFDPPQKQNIRNDYLFLIQSYCNDFSPFKQDEIAFKVGKSEQIETLMNMSSCYRVLVHPGSAWKNKEIGQEALVEALKRIEKVKKVTFLFAYGSESEKALSSQLHAIFPHSSQLVSPLSLPHLQELMRRVDLVMAMDSLPLHLCGTTSTPSLSFFGPSLAFKYLPMAPNSHFIQGSCPYNITFEKRCPQLRTCKTGACIKNITAGQIFDRFLDISKCAR